MKLPEKSLGEPGGLMQIPDRIEKVDIRIKQLLMSFYKKDKECFPAFLEACTNPTAKNEAKKYWSSIPDRLLKKECNLHFDELHPRKLSIQSVQVEKPKPASSVKQTPVKNQTPQPKPEVQDSRAVLATMQAQQEKQLVAKESLGLAPTPATPTEKMKCEEVPWEAVTFNNGCIWLYNSRLNGEVILKSKGYLTIPCKESRESFNKIKKLFVQRVPKIKAYVNNNNLVDVVSEFDVQEVIRIIKEIETYEDWGYKDGPMLSSLNLNIARNIDHEKVLRELKKRKSKYLDYLATKQELHRKVVPCKEHLCYDAVDSEEDAFIFTLKSTLYNHELLVVENVNVARSTLVFVVHKLFFDKALRVVFDFVRSNEKNKRQRLHYNEFDFTGSGIRYYSCINHSAMMEWASKLRRM